MEPRTRTWSLEPGTWNVQRSRLRSPLAVILLVILAVPALAHHSVAGQFDMAKPMVLSGTISKIDWVNPHIYIYLDVKDAKGEVTVWALNGPPTAMLRRAGLTRETVMGKPGEIVTANIAPARDGTKNLAWVSKITYPDGRFHQFAGQ
jgi:hypothetical protein